MTAASYGDAEVAEVLIEAGADIEARASTDAGGGPGGTALMHASSHHAACARGAK
jgi:ankyrin repeat protein